MWALWAMRVRGGVSVSVSVSVSVIVFASPMQYFRHVLFAIFTPWSIISPSPSPSPCLILSIIHSIWRHWVCLLPRVINEPLINAQQRNLRSLLAQIIQNSHTSIYRYVFFIIIVIIVLPTHCDAHGGVRRNSHRNQSKAAIGANWCDSEASRFATRVTLIRILKICNKEGRISSN